MNRRIFIAVAPMFAFVGKLFGGTKSMDNPKGLPVIGWENSVEELFAGIPLEEDRRSGGVIYRRERLVWVPPEIARANTTFRASYHHQNGFFYGEMQLLETRFRSWEDFCPKDSCGLYTTDNSLKFEKQTIQFRYSGGKLA
jgi:hypothetical protein